MASTSRSWDRIRSILDQVVVARSSVEGVHTRPADEDIVAVAAVQRIVARAAKEDVVAVTAVGRQGDRTGEAVVLARRGLAMLEMLPDTPESATGGSRKGSIPLTFRTPGRCLNSVSDSAQ
jgi:hypothetical protein